MAVSSVSAEAVVVRRPPESSSALTSLFTMATATAASAEMFLVLVPSFESLTASIGLSLPSVRAARNALSRRAMGSLPATATVSTSSRNVALTASEAALMLRLADASTVSAAPSAPGTTVSVPMRAMTRASMKLAANDAPTPTELPAVRAEAALAASPSDLSALALAVV